MNNPVASTVASAIACVKSALTDPDIPFNDGVKRVITVDAPYGSILNPKPPAPVRARLLPSNRVFNAVMKALAQIAPGDVIATGTPGGVGAGRTPPLWMKHGDTVEIDITGVGCLSNRVVEQDAA